MTIQLIEDLGAQRKQLKLLFIKVMILSFALFLTDRVLAHFLVEGLEKYYGLDAPADVLLIGHSHTVLAVDKVALEESTGFRVAKYARQGANATDRLAMLEQYLSRYENELEAVIYGVDAYSFTGSQISANSYQLFFPFMGDTVIIGYLKDWNVPKSQLLVRQLSHLTRFEEATLGMAARGWLGKWSNLKRGNVDLNRLQQEIANGNYRQIGFDESEIRVFEQVVKEVTGRDISLVIAFYPTIDILNATEPAKFAEAMKKFSDYAERSEKVHFFDFVTEFQSERDLFFDPIHLNPEGQKRITERLVEELEKLQISAGG